MLTNIIKKELSHVSTNTLFMIIVQCKCLHCLMVRKGSNQYNVSVEIIE